MKAKAKPEPVGYFAVFENSNSRLVKKIMAELDANPKMKFADIAKAVGKKTGKLPDTQAVKDISFARVVIDPLMKKMT